MRTFLAAPPVSAFAMVMGLSGLSLTWSKFSHVSQFQLAQDVSLAFGFLAIALFLVLAVGLVRKQIQTPEKLVEEWNHPVKSSFFGAISVGVCLLAAVIVPYSFRWLKLFGSLELAYI
jgi:tellurite resistance protein